jgi:hypothetical protein
VRVVSLNSLSDVIEWQYLINGWVLVSGSCVSEFLEKLPGAEDVEVERCVDLTVI